MGGFSKLPAQAKDPSCGEQAKPSLDRFVMHKKRHMGKDRERVMLSWMKGEILDRHHYLTLEKSFRLLQSMS